MRAKPIVSAVSLAFATSNMNMCMWVDDNPAATAPPPPAPKRKKPEEEEDQDNDDDEALLLSLATSKPRNTLFVRGRPANVYTELLWPMVSREGYVGRLRVALRTPGKNGYLKQHSNAPILDRLELYLHRKENRDNGIDCDFVRAVLCDLQCLGMSCHRRHFPVLPTHDLLLLAVKIGLFHMEPWCMPPSAERTLKKWSRLMVQHPDGSVRHVPIIVGHLHDHSECHERRTECSRHMMATGCAADGSSCHSANCRLFNALTPQLLHMHTNKHPREGKQEEEEETTSASSVRQRCNAAVLFDATTTTTGSDSFALFRPDSSCPFSACI